MNLNNELTASACKFLLLGEFTVRGGEESKPLSEMIVNRI